MGNSYPRRTVQGRTPRRIRSIEEYHQTFFPSSYFQKQRTLLSPELVGEEVAKVTLARVRALLRKSVV